MHSKLRQSCVGLIYVFTRVTAVPLRQAVTYKSGDAVRSVPRIADQRLARPEQQHQQNTQYAHHRKNRLVQDHPDDTVPEPGRVALNPGPERLLAGLMNIVPELAKTGKPQGLVGDP